MPASMAESGEEAHQLAKNTMVDAMKQAGEAEGFATVYDPSRSGRFSAGNNLIVILEHPEAGCPTAASRKPQAASRKPQAAKQCWIFATSAHGCFRHA